MSEPVLYVDIFGAVTFFPPATQENLHQFARETGQQLLEQDAEILKLQEELEAERLWIKEGRKLHEGQKEEIENLKHSLWRQQTRTKRLHGGLMEQKALVVKRNDTIAMLQKSRKWKQGAPGQVIDAQEKIISKLQAENKLWSSTLDGQNEELLKLAREVLKLQVEVKKQKDIIESRESEAGEWSDIAGVRFEEISDLRDEIKGLKDDLGRAISIILDHAS